MSTTYANWGESIIKLTWLSERKLPLRELITSVHGFCFYDNDLMLVNLNHRGWDFPGGHLEPGETAEEGFKREVMEEGYVSGECKQIGYIIVDHSENPFWSESSKYPMVGYQVFYRMDITQIHEFHAQYESAERIFINPCTIKKYYRDWHELYEEILKCSLDFPG
ncbi:NUDIX domain-containing protein [Bacillus sp. JJ1122]|uniref:NUDIX domain-containing protein n=1 Tax=Bacillus sp. JJ1122 TaxID=3122951 RepID=UPI002FFD606E